MIALLLRLGLSEKLAGMLSKVLPWIGGILLFGAILLAARCDAYNDGERASDARWNAKIEADAKAQRDREQKAGEDLRNQQRIDDLAGRQREQEITNATRNIPDQQPSDRQRARACIELRRQSAADGRPQPAC